MRTLYLSMLLLCLLTTGITNDAHAQQGWDPKWKLDSLNQAYSKGNLDKETYLKAARQVFNKGFSQGISYESKEMLQFMRRTKEIAWSDVKLKKERGQYYIMMANNARIRNRCGEALYYCDKADKEFNAVGYKTLFALGQQCYFFSENEGHAETIEAYKVKYDYITTLPDLLRKDSMKNPGDITVFSILELVCMAYANLKDTVHLQQTIDLAVQIRQAVFAKIDPASGDAAAIDFMINGMYRHQAGKLLNNNQKLRHSLNAFREILDRPSFFPDLGALFEAHLLHWEFEYYIDIRNKDSAAFLLAKIKASDISAGMKPYQVAQYEAGLFAIQGDFHNAYEKIDAAIKGRDTVIRKLTTDMDDLLYAYTEAENNREELLKAENLKQKKNLLILLISVSGVLLIVLIYYLMKRKDIKASKKIEQLNHAAELQIAGMEEVKLNERNVIQRKLGMDLHDNLGSHLAGIKHQMENFCFGVENEKLKVQFTNIMQQVDAAYALTRNKSHEWVLLSKSDAERSFEERIRFLVDRIFPDSHFTKNVEVDDDALQHIPVETKIVLLRIIQEAMINIVKHAAANEITILLYLENGYLVLHIGDNGRGLNTEKLKDKHNHLGLASMRELAAQFNAVFKIESCGHGTTVTVRMPVCD